MRSPLKLKVGLALGGGAARGLAHVGVLRAFEEENIPIDILVGTSMGAIIGGAYAAEPDAVKLEHRVREVLSSEAFQKNRLSFLRETKRQRGGLMFSVANLVRKGIFYGVSTLRSSFLSAEAFAGSMDAILPDVDIEHMPTRFGAVALDIEAAREIVLCHGSLRRATRASSAIPGILPPVSIDGRMLIDGGWVDKIPVLPAYKMGADVVIAVDITAGLPRGTDYNRGVDIMVRANEIKDATLVAHLRRMASIVIEPEVKRVHWADFGAYDRCIAAGAAAARRVMPQIHQMLRHGKLFSVLRPGLGRKLADLHLRTAELDLAVEEQGS